MTLGPFITTPRAILAEFGIPLSEVLLAIEVGELGTAGSDASIRVKEAERWVSARAEKRTTPHVDLIAGPPPPAPEPPVNPLTGLVHHELVVDPVTGRRLE